MYLDRGYDATKEFIDRVVMSQFEEVMRKQLYKDPKSQFQEEAQERAKITPTYNVIRESGPDHDRRFVVGAYLEEELVAEGEGPSKQIAQEEAARNALVAKGWG